MTRDQALANLDLLMRGGTLPPAARAALREYVAKPTTAPPPAAPVVVTRRDAADVERIRVLSMEVAAERKAHAASIDRLRRQIERLTAKIAVQRADAASAPLVPLSQVAAATGVSYDRLLQASGRKGVCKCGAGKSRYASRCKDCYSRGMR